MGLSFYSVLLAGQWQAVPQSEGSREEEEGQQTKGALLLR